MVKINLSTGAFGSFNERRSGKQMKENKDNNTFKDTIPVQTQSCTWCEQGKHAHSLSFFYYKLVFFFW